ncbi:DUF3301 domain-containing protein [Cognatilysobacter segetis]|uniref:DUF3301 domain-containing protein n=1 Tax=Cognatilysobacter segetis TaxID=2492394 RepID=UPI00105CA949|nr:DUF3301 domain-containing protein [Lysobacter segetis]
MPSLIVLMLVAAAAVAFWNASRAATERARELGRDACRAANVQWLDEAVHAIALRPCRLRQGRLGWERTFRFDYSVDGRDRHSGRLVLRGDRLVSFVGPPAPEPLAFPARSSPRP